MFIIKPFLTKTSWPKRRDKNLIILSTKRAFKMKKAFFIIFKGLSLKQIKKNFGRWEPDFKITNIFMINAIQVTYVIVIIFIDVDSNINHTVGCNQNCNVNRVIL